MLLGLEAAGLGEEDAAAWVRERLDLKEKIMGMGHPVYKTFDPRSKVLRESARRLATDPENARRYRLLERIEEECHKEFERRGQPTIKSNVDFYSGLLYSMMDIPLHAMTAMFAISLAAGWCAHIIEEKFAEAQGKPALYRPQADYIGDYCGPIGCRYRSLDERD